MIEGEIDVMQTGSPRKPSRLVFVGAVGDAGQRRWGKVVLLRVSSLSGGSWNRVLSHLDPYQFKCIEPPPADNAQLIPLPGVQARSSHVLCASLTARDLVDCSTLCVTV